MTPTTHQPQAPARRGLLRRCLPYIGTALLGVASALSAQATTVSVTATGAGTWTIPANVTSVTVVAAGGGGSSGGGPNGGAGRRRRLAANYGLW